MALCACNAVARNVQRTRCVRQLHYAVYTGASHYSWLPLVSTIDGGHQTVENLMGAAPRVGLARPAES